MALLITTSISDVKDEPSSVLSNEMTMTTCSLDASSSPQPLSDLQESCPQKTPPPPYPPPSTLDTCMETTARQFSPFALFQTARRSPYAVILLVSLALFTDMVVYGVIIPILPEVLANVGISPDKEIQYSTFLFITYSVGLFVSTPIFGILSDKYQNRQIPLLIGLFGLGVTTLLFALAKVYWLLLVARALQGVAAAATWVIGLALLADIFASQRLGAVMGICFSFNTLGMLSGPLIGGFVVYYSNNIEMPFYICTALASLDLIGRLLIEPVKYSDVKNTTSLSTLEMQTMAKDPKEELLKAPADEATLMKKGRFSWIFNNDLIILMHHTEVSVFGMTIVIGASAISIIESLVATYLERKFHATTNEITLVFLGSVIPNIIVSILLGYLSEQMSRSRLMMLGFVLHILAHPFFALAGNLWQFAFASIYFGLTFPIFLTPTLSEMAVAITRLGYTSSYARLYAIVNICYAFGMTLGPLLGGLLYEKESFLAAMLMMPCVIIVWLPFFTVFILRIERKRAGLPYAWRDTMENFWGDLIHPLKHKEATTASISTSP